MRSSFRKASSILMLSLFSLMLLTGCQSPSLSIKTNPEGAKIYIMEHYVAGSPTSQKPNEWPWKTINVKIEKDGFKTQNSQSHHSLNDTGVVVLVVGIFVLPVLLGLLAPGCWDLSPDTMDIQLEENR